MSSDEWLVEQLHRDIDHNPLVCPPLDGVDHDGNAMHNERDDTWVYDLKWIVGRIQDYNLHAPFIPPGNMPTATFQHTSSAGRLLLMEATNGHPFFNFEAVRSAYEVQCFKTAVKAMAGFFTQWSKEEFE